MVATHPDHRRLGCARAVVSALLDHLADVDDVTLFELHTSPEAAPLYREFGFSGSPAPMRMTRHRQAAGAVAGGQRESTWVPPQQFADTLPRAAAYVCLYVTDEDDRPLRLHSVYSPGHPWHMIGGAMDLGGGITLNPREHDEARVLPLAGAPSAPRGTPALRPGCRPAERSGVPTRSASRRRPSPTTCR